MNELHCFHKCISHEYFHVSMCLVIHFGYVVDRWMVFVTKLEVKIMNTFMFKEMFDNESDIVFHFFELCNVFIFYNLSF